MKGADHRTAQSHCMPRVSWNAMILKYITVALMSRTIPVPVFLQFVVNTYWHSIFATESCKWCWFQVRTWLYLKFQNLTLFLLQGNENRYFQKLSGISGKKKIASHIWFQNCEISCETILGNSNFSFTLLNSTLVVVQNQTTACLFQWDVVLSLKY